MRAIVFAGLLASTAAVSQVHTALGLTEDSLTVSWASATLVKDPVVMYGEGTSITSTTAADSRAFTQDPGRTWYTHVATLTGLKTNTMYSYKVGTTGDYSEVFTVMNRRLRDGTTDPYRHIILGDLGAACAFSVCTACQQHSNTCNATTCSQNTTVGMVAETASADMFLHVGDFAYDLGTDNGTIGDIFMNNVEQISANNVYMVSHGNHEDSAINLAHYVERYRNMPVNAEPPMFNTSNGLAPNNLYFSWDHALVHYVSISTELFFGVTDGKTTADTLLTWLKADLEKANQNRDKVPWIIVEGHRSVYCTCDGDCVGPAKKLRDAIEDVLFDGGVDYFVNGHEHNYERTYPLYQNKSDRSTTNPRAPIYVVSGAAGSHEMHEPFTLPQPEWSAYRSNSFSYSRVLVHNFTHLHWQQVQTDPSLFPLADYGRVIDDYWVVTDRHGPFNKSDAPTHHAGEYCRDAKCESHDHWEPLLNMEKKEGETLVSSIQRFRKEKGESAWKGKLRGLMQLARDHAEDAKNSAIWENVRGDGNSDSAWLSDNKYQWTGNQA